MLDDLEARGAQLREKTLRITDAGHGVHPLARKPRQRHRLGSAANERESITEQAHRERTPGILGTRRPPVPPLAVDHDRVHGADPRRAVRATARLAADSHCRSRAHASITAISKLRAKARCCRPSSDTMTSTPPASSRRAARTRLRPTATGAPVRRCEQQRLITDQRRIAVGPHRA